jgi:hypothetical protein
VLIKYPIQRVKFGGLNSVNEEDPCSELLGLLMSAKINKKRSTVLGYL